MPHIASVASSSRLTVTHVSYIVANASSTPASQNALVASRRSVDLLSRQGACSSMLHRRSKKFVEINAHGIGVDADRKLDVFTGRFSDTFDAANAF